MAKKKMSKKQREEEERRRQRRERDADRRRRQQGEGEDEDQGALGAPVGGEGGVERSQDPITQTIPVPLGPTVQGADAARAENPMTPSRASVVPGSAGGVEKRGRGRPKKNPVGRALETAATTTGCALETAAAHLSALETAASHMGSATTTSASHQDSAPTTAAVQESGATEMSATQQEVGAMETSAPSERTVLSRLRSCRCLRLLCQLLTSQLCAPPMLKHFKQLMSSETGIASSLPSR